MITSQIIGMIFFILMAIVALASFSYIIYSAVLLTKDKRKERPFDSTYKKLLILSLINVTSFTGMAFFIYLWNNYSPNWWQIIKCLFGSIVLSSSLSVGSFSFIIHYYCKNMPAKLDKKLFIYLMVSTAICFIGLLMFTDGFADMGGYHFLLPNGINFNYGFVTPDTKIDGVHVGPNIAFYAICILSGAVFVYFLCDHKLYLKYGKHGLIESTFFVALPAGIIGARIFYVIGNWSKEFANQPFWKVIAIWEGGLTILGGAVVGIIVGILWLRYRHKELPAMEVIDILVPSILIAQAIGRWGNFFNCEVHGIQMSEQYWGWLPRIVINNARFSSTNGWATDGNIYVPLFFIEAIVNLLGFFVLSHLFNIKLKKYILSSDITFGYIIWYGLTRTFMEPLRDASFNMGSDGYWSWFWSIMFVFVGSLLILLNHLIRFFINKKKNIKNEINVKNNCIFSSICILISFGFIIVGVILMATNPSPLKIAFNLFNDGLIFLTIGLAVLFIGSISIFKLICYSKNKEIYNA